MPGWMLNATATVHCTHAAGVGILRQVVPSLPGRTVLLSGLPALTTDDVASVVGCPFTVGPKVQPCVTVVYPGLGLPSLRVTLNGKAAILSDTLGLAKSADEIPAGPSLTPLTVCQTRVVAQ